MESRVRASPEQFSILLDFMERHRDLSRPHSGLQGRINSHQLWQQLTDVLNSHRDGVKKSPHKWKKVWADWKAKTKKKYLSLRFPASTCGGPIRRMSVSALEERVLAVLGVSTVVGQAGIQKQCFHPENDKELPIEHPQYDLDIVLEDSNSQNIAIPAPASPAVDPLLQPEEDTPASAPQSPPPFPHTPPSRNSQHQGSASPRSPFTTRRRTLLRARRNRGLTSFEWAADLFATIERRRLMLEEESDKRLHEREMERIRLEAEKIEVTRQQNNVLHELTLLGQRLIDVITQQRPSSFINCIN